MPYKIIRRKDGFYVYNPQTKKTYSKKGLSKTNATKQRLAIILSEHPNVKDVNKFFV